MKGSVLANLINEELYPGKNKVGIIQQNVEKGKNLETATIKVCKTWIDFVNLRCEEKDKIGTPLSDAERRDLSINWIILLIRKELNDESFNSIFNEENFPTMHSNHSIFIENKMKKIK